MLAKIDHLTYYLQLPSVMRIHSVILIVQLESIVTTITEEASDLYKRYIDNELLSITNNENDVEIERIINKRIIYSKPYYLLK